MTPTKTAALEAVLKKIEAAEAKKPRPEWVKRQLANKVG